MNVLQVKQSLAKLDESFLNYGIKKGSIKQNEEGVKDVEYYIIPTDLRVHQNQTYNAIRLNALMQQAQMRQYNYIMLIIDTI